MPMLENPKDLEMAALGGGEGGCPKDPPDHGLEAPFRVPPAPLLSGDVGGCVHCSPSMFLHFCRTS